ncbi:sensor histidine kinase [Anaeromyxobacter terrae]|uniref:sensor histidine kinase n=1 Tax=Anaeromyxobacter terrae TaxID=2925406 RepID=UPI001F5704D9|nr:ATP-binding protein [Anaeromyxobacter sp. SG22]
MGTALARIAEGVVVADSAGGVVFAHAKGRTYQAEATPGPPAEEEADRLGLSTLDGRPLAFAETPLGLALRGRSIVDALIRARRPDGTDAVVRTCAAPIRDAVGRPIGAYAMLHDVTEAHRAEAALRESAAHLQAIFRAQPDLYFQLGADGTYLACIPGRAADLFAAPEHLLGRRVRDVLPAPAARLFEDAIGEAIRTGEVRTIEYPLPLPQGEQHFEARIVSLSEREVVAVVRNVTERVRAAEALRRVAAAESTARRAAEEREGQLRAILAALREGVTVVDRRGAVILRNRAACEAVGLRDGEAPGPENLSVARPGGEPVPPAQWPIERIRRGEEFEDEELVVTHRDGTTRRVVTGARVVRDETGETVAGIVVSRDVTELRRLEQSREDLLRTVSHDLRTPLSVVLGSANALARQLEAGSLVREGEQVARITRSARRMASLISDLVDSARYDAGRLELRRVPTHLGRLVEAALRSLPAGPSGRVRVVASEDVPPVQVDPARLERVIVNLLTNALKYSPPDAPVEVRVSRADGEAVVSVSDRGVGVPPEELPRLFERYYRARSAGRTEGIGLGLYIARQLVLAHGGRIWAESRVGAGSTFAFALPI